MGRSRITEKGRAGRKRGKGHGKDYKPWIEVQDFNSMGTGAILVDPVSGRQMHFLSMGEKYVFYKIMWEEGPAEVREQFPLELAETNRIAAELGFLPASRGEKHMTTDMLITHRNGKKEAISVKGSKSEIFAEEDGTVTGNKRAAKAARKRELLFIEKKYWEEKGIGYRLVFAEDLDPVYVHNIEAVMRCYDEDFVRDDISFVKHLIAHHAIEVDLREKLNFRQLADEYIVD